MNIRLQAERIRELQLKNAKIENEIEAEPKKEKQDGVESIMATVVAKIGLNKKSHGEKINALKKSVSSFLDFLDQGGQLDLVLPEPPTEDEGEDRDEELQQQLADLRDQTSQIRRLKSSVKQLGPGDNYEGGDD